LKENQMLRLSQQPQDSHWYAFCIFLKKSKITKALKYSYDYLTAISAKTGPDEFDFQRVN
jgi:hypothetical protein